MRKLLVVGLLLTGALALATAQAEEGNKAPAPSTEGGAAREATRPAAPAAPAAAVTSSPAPSSAAAPAATGQQPAASATTRPGSDAQGQAVMPRTPAEFAEAMGEQVTQLGLTPHCTPEKGQCHYWYRSASNTRHEIQLWYHQSSRSIYIFVNHFAEATMNNAATPALLRHAAAASRVVNIGRFEWNSSNGEVRLSAVVNVDTNLDRQALRNLLRLLQAAVDQFAPGFAAILADHEKAGQLPTATPTTPGRTVTDSYGYMNAIEQELQGLGLRPQCQAPQGRCTYEIDSTEARTIVPFAVEFDSQAGTVVVRTERYLTAPVDNPRTDRLLQQLMELNWQQLAPMYQWSATDGKVRLAGALNTDSNLDRRAFRSVVQSVNRVAQRNFRQLRGILNP